MRYEDFITDCESTIRSVVDFVGEEFCPEMLESYKYATVRQGPWKTGSKTLFKESIGRWRSPKYKARIESLYKYPGALELLKYYRYI